MKKKSIILYFKYNVNNYNTFDHKLYDDIKAYKKYSGNNFDKSYFDVNNFDFFVAQYDGNIDFIIDPNNYSEDGMSIVQEMYKNVMICEINKHKRSLNIKHILE